jgi:hypothetical protein
MPMGDVPKEVKEQRGPEPVRAFSSSSRGSGRLEPIDDIRGRLGAFAGLQQLERMPAAIRFVVMVQGCQRRAVFGRANRLGRWAVMHMKKVGLQGRSSQSERAYQLFMRSTVSTSN